MRIVFLGTPEFAVASLKALVEANHDVPAVYTQPDRPKGRGQALAASPVKLCALEEGIAVRQPLKVREPAVIEELREWQADLMVVVGYGQIIPQAVVDLPRLGIVNVHASLLPKYRGAAPIQWAVASGERVTGVTTMQIDAGLDTGAMLLKAETPIGPEETAAELSLRLAQLGAELLVRTIDGLACGAIAPEPQDESKATWAPVLKKEDGLIDWTWPASTVHNRARGFFPWPGAYTHFRGKRLNIVRCRPAAIPQPAEPGSLYSHERSLYVSCGGGTSLELLEVQMEGRKAVTAADFLNGHRPLAGEKL